VLVLLVFVLGYVMTSLCMGVIASAGLEDIKQEL
jgi:hypothetical protein